MRDGGFSQLVVEPDCQNLIAAVQNPLRANTYLGNIVEDIQMMVSQFQVCKFAFIPHSVNQVAHKLAQLARNSIEDDVLLEEVPSAAHSFVLLDVLSAAFS